ncbi:acetolactate synthase [Aspergillus sclerotiicarbonarius CBS 121057]|uniref:Acetolactate synthase n=1 Tax=Aspergillus sclerotiicarbonarius (strain CBS 121057 / IBT 28362) TaxID=1448318 RepID=A0A319ECW4_ASPSB|nr:acetolactate synthase [Aspergillus sclerotiicarbonarius CBS 121057]
MDRLDLLNQTGGDILRQLLLAHDVDHIFGYIGGAALPLFDHLSKPGASTPAFNFIHAHHEQGAGHMAEGYARAANKPGIVLVTSGPGTSNTVTPMLDALLDGTPIIVICGQVATSVQGTHAFQEIDVVSLARPCTKWCTCVQSIADLPASIDAAFHHATSNRPGPTLLAIPKDVGEAIFDAAALHQPSFIPDIDSASETSTRASTPTRMYNMATHYDQIDHIADLVNRSQRPVICAGNGVINSRHGPALLAQLSQRSHIPVTTTLLGLGSFDESLPEALHMVGTYGTPYANLAIQSADLILALGARLDERAVDNPKLFAPAARHPSTGLGIIHFDISPSTVGQVIPPTETIAGDLSDTLPILLSNITPNPRTTWLQTIQHWKTTYPLPTPLPSPSTPITAEQIITTLSRHTPPTTTTLTTGVGQHQMHTARSYTFPRLPGSFVTSGSMGTMGFGLPAAIGAKLARPEHTVIDIDGDASFCMTMSELLTARQSNVAIKVIIMNNDGQGMVRQIEGVTKEEKKMQWCTRQGNPDFVRLAESMGVVGRRCSRGGELEGDIRWLVGCEGPAVLEVVSEDGMRPMVRLGGGLDDIVF